MHFKTLQPAGSDLHRENNSGVFALLQNAKRGAEDRAVTQNEKMGHYIYILIQ